nr:hypothetical protein [uncultured Flavobacterium sp.]
MNSIIYKSIGSFNIVNEYGLKLLFRFIVIDNMNKIGQCHITLKFNDGRYRTRFISVNEMIGIHNAIKKLNDALKIGTAEELKSECFVIYESSGFNYSILADNTNGLVFKMKVKAENYYHEFDITNHLDTFNLFNQTDATLFKNQLNK